MQALSGEPDGRAVGEEHPGCAGYCHVRAPLSVWKQTTEVWGAMPPVKHTPRVTCVARASLLQARGRRKIFVVVAATGHGGRCSVIAGALPFSIAPAIAPAILATSGDSYGVVFLVAGACAVTGAPAIVPIRVSGDLEVHEQVP